MTRVEWTHTVETSRFLRLLALAGFGAIGALPLLGAVLALWLVASVAAAGDFEALGVLLAVGLAVVVLAGRRLAFHAALFREAEDGPGLWLPFREIAAASAAWATVAVALAVLDVPFAVIYGLFVASVFVLLPAVAALSSEGAVDTAEDALHVGDRELPLAAVDRATRRDLGPVSVLRIHYHHGAPDVFSPRFLGVAPADAERVRDALESSTAEPPAPNSKPLVAAVLAAFGVGLLGFAALLGYVAATGSLVSDGRVIFAYAAVFAGVFGALFLALARHER